MTVVTFLVYLPKYDYSYEEQKLQELQHKLDYVIGYNKTGIDVNYTPLNETTTLTPAIWALGRTEDENRIIIEKVKEFLNKNNIEYREFQSYIFWNEEILYKEFRPKIDISAELD